MSAAKALALTLDVPYVGVNHLEAHLHAAWLEDPTVELPLAVLIVSGGHTMVVIVEGDAQLPAARPDGRRRRGRGVRQGRALPRPRLSRAARRSTGSRATATRRAIAFPRPMRNDGLRLLLLRARRPRSSTHVRRHPDVGGARPRRVVPGGGGRRAGRRSWSRPRTRPAPAPSSSGAGSRPTPGCGPGCVEAAEESGRRALLPRLELCTDNGAMIAATAWWRLERRRPHLALLRRLPLRSACPTRGLTRRARAGPTGCLAGGRVLP